MQAFPHGSRFAMAASAERSETATYRLSFLGRRHVARHEGIAAGKAAEVVGVPRSTLFSCEKPGQQCRFEFRCRMPRHLLSISWTLSISFLP